MNLPPRRLAFPCLLFAAFFLPAGGVSPPVPAPSPQGGAAEAERSIELFALDPLRSHWNLATMGYAATLQDGEYVTARSHLAFAETPAGKDELVAGITERKARILDLGDLRSVDTNQTFFPALFVEHDSIRLANPRKYGRTLPLFERLGQLGNDQSRLEVRLGHVYFVEIGDGRDVVRAFVRIVRHVDGQSVTLSCRRCD